MTLHQQSLFDGGDLVQPIVARARANDPETSHLAATEVTANGTIHRHGQLIIAYLKTNPGQTNGEIAEGSGLDYARVHKRMKELEELNLAIRGEKRYCTTDGRRTRLYTSWYPK